MNDEASYDDVLVDHWAVGRPMEDLPTPAPLVDLSILETNIETMVEFFRDRPVHLRPHVKTHRAPAVARRQVKAGAHGITCAKVSMAEAMVAGGIDDVYVANQVVSRSAINRLCQLAKRAIVTVAVDDAENVTELSEAARAHGVRLKIVVEIDAGMGRCGVPPGVAAVDLAHAVERADRLEFIGLHAYEGHVVDHPDVEYREAETHKMLEFVMESRECIEQSGLPVSVVTCGGSGTYQISGTYPGVTEHQSGSYVYMDTSYAPLIPQFGLAFSVLCTVVSRPTGEKVITDGGIQVLAGDYGTPAVKGHPELECKGLSEEHGTYRTKDGTSPQLAVGDPVEVIPGHCCSAANLHDWVYGVRNGEVETVWAVTARGKSW